VLRVSGQSCAGSRTSHHLVWGATSALPLPPSPFALQLGKGFVNPSLAAAVGRRLSPRQRRALCPLFLYSIYVSLHSREARLTCGGDLLQRVER